MKAALTPPWCATGKKLESSIRKAIFEYRLLDGVERLAVALSGGKDSISLLAMLKAISGRGMPDFQIVAIHVSGTFSCGAGVNSNYLKTLCDELQVPLIVREANQPIETLECYSCSRRRRTLIFDAAKEMRCTHVAFGHHRDDNAETFLMNLLHKGECAGLLPKLEMVDYGITIIRPLILADEKEIISFAQNSQFLRITCQCPVGQKSKRKVADSLLQEMEHHFPHARSNIASASLTYGSQKAAIPKKRT